MLYLEEKYGDELNEAINYILGWIVENPKRTYVQISSEAYATFRIEIAIKVCSYIMECIHDKIILSHESIQNIRMSGKGLWQWYHTRHKRKTFYRFDEAGVTRCSLHW
jgi:hypothetical protein